jgi:hypothetical protein
MAGCSEAFDSPSEAGLGESEEANQTNRRMVMMVQNLGGFLFCSVPSLLKRLNLAKERTT